MQTDNTKSLSPIKALVWILCLAAAAVGAKNFEEGLSVDAPLYAAIGRNVARTSSWFTLPTQIPDFQPFAEHPHLGFWLLATVFKILPSADWSARIPGHLFYVLFLWILFVYLRRFANEAVAFSSVILLFLWYRFANFFSNVYLDPGLLFFGAASVFLMHVALEKKKGSLAQVAGLALGCAFLYKGFAALGFIAALILIQASYFFKIEKRPQSLHISLFFWSALAGVFGLYIYLLSNSSNPDFLSHYFHRQFSERTNREWNWFGSFRWSFWDSILKDTYYLAPLAFLPLFSRPISLRALLPWSLLSPFLILYSCAGLEGGQYWITVLPWIAWLVSEALFGKLDFLPARPPHLREAAPFLSYSFFSISQNARTALFPRKNDKPSLR